MQAGSGRARARRRSHCSRAAGASRAAATLHELCPALRVIPLSSLAAMRHKKIASEREEPMETLAMDCSDTDSDATLGYSDDEDSSDEVQRVSESVHRKLYLQIFGVFFMLCDFTERNF